MSKVYYLVRKGKKGESKIGTVRTIKSVLDSDECRKKFKEKLKNDRAFRTRVLRWTERPVEDYIKDYEVRAKIGGKNIKTAEQTMTTAMYELGTVTHSENNVLKIETKNGKRAIEVDTKVHNEPPLVCSYDPQHDGPIEDLPEDVSEINGFGEAALLVCMKRTLIEKLSIYTYVADIVLCINPYMYIPAMVDIAEPPHVVNYKLGTNPTSYATAHFAYWNQFDPETYPSECLNQSCIVSGESGAGKTVACGFIMKYLAKLSEWRREKLKMEVPERDITKLVGGVSPFLEAFGNAKTTMNDNSSRFGKFQKILFSNGMIVGGDAESYLLEKARLSFQGVFERNYHIFYQLCAGASPEERKRLNLKFAHEYDALTMGCAKKCKKHKHECVIIEHEIHHGEYSYDKDRFNNPLNDDPDETGTRAALRRAGVPDEKQNKIWDCIAALLKLGDLKFVHDRNSPDSQIKSIVREDCVSLCDEIAGLLGLSHIPKEKGLAAMLVINRREIPNEGSIDSPQPPDKCSKIRFALLKDIYSRLFDYLFRCVNKVLEPSQSPDAFVGILDIFGFEVFKKNGMDQLCINFANEKLQKLFNDHVFKREKAIYESEGIPKEIIPPYRDNSPCCDLIEKTHKTMVGIFPSLDEKGSTKCNDETWCGQVLNRFGRSDGPPKNCKSMKIRKCGKYISGKKGAGNEYFMIRHFAGNVKYHVHGWLEKNNDKIPLQLPDLMRASECEFVQDLYKKRKSIHGKRKPKFATIACKFVLQLRSLAETLGATTPHYVRCVKPNSVHMRPVDGNVCFDAFKTYRQLLYAGVMEVCQIKKDGYPFRETYDRFWKKRVLKNRWNRYLSPQLEDEHNAKNGTIELFRTILPGTVKVGKRGEQVDRPQWCEGKTMVFSKDYAMGSFDEWARRTVSHKIQKWWRKCVFEKRLQYFEIATTRLQIAYRKLLFRRKMARVECDIVRAKAMLRAVSSRAIYAKRRDLRRRVNTIKRTFRAYHIYTTWSRTAYSIERLEDVRIATVQIQKAYRTAKMVQFWNEAFVRRRKIYSAELVKRSLRSSELHENWRAAMNCLRKRNLLKRVVQAWTQFRTYRDWYETYRGLRFKVVESMLRAMSRSCENAIARRKAHRFLRKQLKSLRSVQVIQSHVRSCVALCDLKLSKIRTASLRLAASKATSVSMMSLRRAEMRDVIVASRFCQRVTRARLCRRNYLLKLRSILMIQRNIRGLIHRKRYLRRLRSVHAVQMAYRVKRILRINSSRRDATIVVERAMDRYLNKKRLSDWIIDMQRAVLSSKLDEMRRVMSCPRPYARLRPLLKEQIPNRDRTYNALINLRDREFFDSFLHLAVGLPNALSVTRWLVSEGADPEGRNFKGSSVFHDAVFMGDRGLDLTRYLLSKCTTKSKINPDLLFVLSFECKRFQTSHERRVYLENPDEFLDNTGACATALEIAMSAAKPNDKTVSWLRQRCARVSRDTMLEMKEQEIMNKFLEAEDRDAERIREEMIFDKIRSSPAWKFIELAIARKSLANCSVGMIRIIRFVKAWRAKKNQTQEEMVRERYSTPSPRGRAKTARHAMGYLGNLDEDEKNIMFDEGKRRSTIVTLNMERLNREKRERLEREEHVKQVAMNLRERLKTRSERKKNQKKEFARARALSAHRKWKSSKEEDEEDEENTVTIRAPDHLDSPQENAHAEDSFAASLNSIADLEVDLHDIEKEILNGILPSAHSYDHRKEMTQHRVSTLIQDIHEEIRNISENVDPRELLDRNEDIPKESYKRATMWTNLSPKHFQRSMPEISKDVPLDPPGHVVGVVNDDDDVVVAVEDKLSTDVENHGKKMGEPVYRGISVFHNMERPSMENGEEEEKVEKEQEMTKKDSHLVWKDLLHPQFKDIDNDDSMENILPLTVHCDPDEEENEDRAPPGNVRGASLSTKAYMSNAAIHGAGIHNDVTTMTENNKEHDSPPGQVRNASLATKHYMKGAEKKALYRGLSVFEKKNECGEDSHVESSESDNEEHVPPPGQVRNASVATKSYMKGAEKEPLYRGLSVFHDGHDSMTMNSSLEQSDSMMGSPPGKVKSYSIMSSPPEQSDSISSPPGQVRNASIATKHYVGDAENGQALYHGHSVFKQSIVASSKKNVVDNRTTNMMTEEEEEEVTRTRLTIPPSLDPIDSKEEEEITSKEEEKQDHVITEEPEILKTTTRLRSTEALLKAITMIEDLSSEKMGWEYTDTKGTIHGPYSTRQMRHWFVNGCFSLRLPVRHVPKGHRSPVWAAPFQKISDIFRPSHAAFDTTNALKLAKEYLQDIL